MTPPPWKRPPLDAIDAELALVQLEERLKAANGPIVEWFATLVAEIPHPHQRADAWDGLAEFYETTARMLRIEANLHRRNTDG